MGLAASKQEAFWEACGFGHTERVKRFIEDGIDVNWVSYTHNSCAIHVASQGKPKIVKMLIEANCEVNAKDDRGNLAIHHAAMKGEAECMQLLISAGSQINTPDKNGWTALINAAYWCQPEAVRLLIKHKCDVTFQNKDDRSALHEACRSPVENEEYLAEIAALLIQNGSDINSKSSDFGEADFSPLMFCSYHGHIGIAKILVDAGCDINAQGTNGWSALHWAANRNRRDMVEMLLKARVDPLLVDKSGAVAIDRSTDNEIRDILYQALVEARAARKLQREQNPENADKDSDSDSSMAGSLSDLSQAGDDDSPNMENQDAGIASDINSKVEELPAASNDDKLENTTGSCLNDVSQLNGGSSKGYEDHVTNDQERESCQNCEGEKATMDRAKVNSSQSNHIDLNQVPSDGAGNTNDGPFRLNSENVSSLEIPLKKTPGTTNLLSPADSGTDTTPTDPEEENLHEPDEAPGKEVLLSPTKSEKSSGVESQDENDFDEVAVED